MLAKRAAARSRSCHRTNHYVIFTVTRIVVRAIGPSLSALGIANALPDPTLSLYDSNGTGGMVISPRLRLRAWHEVEVFTLLRAIPKPSVLTVGRSATARTLSLLPSWKYRRLIHRIPPLERRLRPKRVRNSAVFCAFKSLQASK